MYKHILRDKVIQGDCLKELTTFPTGSIDFIVTDPPYDLPHDQMRLYHAEMMRVSRGAIIVFCQPETQWIGTPSQYLFWVKPLSTKNTSRSY